MAKANKIKITVNYYPEGVGITSPSSYQEKTFKDEQAAVQWCRVHYKNIGAINDFYTLGQPISHFEIMNAIRGIAR